MNELGFHALGWPVGRKSVESRLIGWTMTDEGEHRRHMVSAHLRRMKMAPGEVCSDGALEAAVT